MEIVEHGGYPELRVDGKPFFIHSAAFFYYRIPRDLWERSLDRYRTLGVNTIDLYIPWNWHEPREGEFDFDGRTNPRRDLRGLLQLIAGKGFRLIARPGPVILNEWRHGGYPGWLLARPEYKMDLVDRLEGRYPPLSSLNARDAEAAARGWLDNATHMAYAGKWLAAVARELAPFSSSRAASGTTNFRGTSRTGGPLLFVQLDDDMAIGRTNFAGPQFWRYMEVLRQSLAAGEIEVPVFINPTDMRVTAAGSALPRPIGVMGQWYMPPRAKGETGARTLNAEDTSTIEFFAEELKTQPAFPPLLVEYQAGWYCPADDDRPRQSPPDNTLLSSRLLLAHGLHGLNYFPLQDTFAPAGYSVPWANRSYRWDAALGPDAENEPRADAVMRNAKFLARWGSLLAASHKRADIGIVYPLGAYPQKLLAGPDILRVSQEIEKLERLAGLAHLSTELLDPEYQPVEQLLRDALMLLPVFDPEKAEFELSEKAQRALVEYVRRGGTLVYFPWKPRGKILEAWWNSPSLKSHAPDSPIRAGWRFGRGHVLECTKDFFSWVSLEQGFEENRARTEYAWAARVLFDFLDAAGVRPATQLTRAARGSDEVIATELASNEGTSLLGARRSGTGFLSVTNLSEDEPADQVWRILSPQASAQGWEEGYLPLRLTIPPRDSLLLPLEIPLCESSHRDPCGDVLVTAGAEFLGAWREGKTLELSFYTPARASLRLRLKEQPRHVTLEDTSPGATWDAKTGELEVVVPRGASPSFLRVLKIELRYKPDVPERLAPKKSSPGDYEIRVADAARLPTGQGESLETYPPLLVWDASQTGRLLCEVRNQNEDWGRDVSLRVKGAFRGSASLLVKPQRAALAAIQLRANKSRADLSTNDPTTPGGLQQGWLEVHSEGDHRRIPLAFLVTREGLVRHYEFDFDRDGANERVLENNVLRFVVSPESGGRALALVDKATGLDLISSMGALRDNFAYAENPPDGMPSRARGRYGLFNRPYRAKWDEKDSDPVLQLDYEAPDVYPHGASVRKRIEFEGADAIRVEYQVALDPPAGGPSDASAQEARAQAFVAVNSLPAFSEAGRTTQICWPQGNERRVEALARGRASEPRLAGRCQLFTPGGATFELPEGARRIEVLTPGRPGLVFEWDSGKLQVEQKNYSVLLRLEFPALAPGGPPGRYSIRLSELREGRRAQE